MSSRLLGDPAVLKRGTSHGNEGRYTAAATPDQRAQNPLIKEYTLNYKIKPPIVLGIILTSVIKNIPETIGGKILWFKVYSLIQGYRALWEDGGQILVEGNGCLNYSQSTPVGQEVRGFRV